MTATLPIRARRTLDGDGEATLTRTVHCGRRNQSLPLDECETCDQCHGITLAESKLVCGWRAARPPQSSALSRLAHKLFPQIANETRVGEVMTGKVLCVTREVSLETLTDLVLLRNIGGVPVVDADGFPIGVVSKTDLVREWRTRGETGEMTREPSLAEGSHLVEAVTTAEDIMMPLAFTVDENRSIADAARMMAIEGIHRVPVVSGDGRVVGILTTLDLVRWLGERGMKWFTIGFTVDDVVGMWQHDRLGRELAAAFAAEQRPPFGVLETAGDGEHIIFWFIRDDAAELFDRQGVNWRRFLVARRELPARAHALAR